MRTRPGTARPDCSLREGNRCGYRSHLAPTRGYYSRSVEIISAANGRTRARKCAGTLEIGAHSGSNPCVRAAPSEHANRLATATVPHIRPSATFGPVTAPQFGRQGHSFEECCVRFPL